MKNLIITKNERKEKEELVIILPRLEYHKIDFYDKNDNRYIGYYVYGNKLYRTSIYHLINGIFVRDIS